MADSDQQKETGQKPEASSAFQSDIKKNTLENKDPSENDSEIKPLRTYESDVAEALKKGDGSLVKIALAEQKRRESGEIFGTVTPEQPKKKLLFIFGSILVVCVILAFIFVAVIPNDRPTPFISEARRILIDESEGVFDIAGLSREKIVRSFENHKQNDRIALGDIHTLVVAEKTGAQKTPLSAGEWFHRLEFSPPEILVRSLLPDFAFGLHGLTRNEPFMVFGTQEHNNAFAGMLLWEKTFWDDLGPIFASNIQKRTSASSTDEIIRATRNLSFEDMVLRNKDTRVLRDGNGVIVLIYSFFDQKTIIITTNPDTLRTVGEKLIASRFVQ